MARKFFRGDEAIAAIERILREVLNHLVLPLLRQRNAIYGMEILYHYRSDKAPDSLDPEGVVVTNVPTTKRIEFTDLVKLEGSLLASKIHEAAVKIWEEIRYDNMKMVIGLGFRFSLIRRSKISQIVMRQIALGGHYTHDFVDAEL